MEKTQKSAVINNAVVGDDTGLKRKTVIHVNQHHIRANKKDGGMRAVLTVKSGKTNQYAHEVDVLGACRVVYSPNKPLSCGARVWIETRADVVLHTQPAERKP